MLTSYLIFLIVGLLLLFYASEIIIRSLLWLARYFKVHEYALAFVVVAFATSLPEFFIGIDSARSGVPIFSFGNIMGANILNVTLAFGAALLWGGRMKFDHMVRLRDIFFTLGMLVLPFVLMNDGALGRIDGVALVFLFGVYIAYLLMQSRVTPTVDHLGFQEYALAKFFRKIFEFAFGVLLLVGASQAVVQGGVFLGTLWGFPLAVMGIFAALGTTLPETIFGLKSVSLHHPSMVFGNSLGSIMVNSSLILGLVALIHPIQISGDLFFRAGFLLPAWIVFFVQLISYFNGEIPRWFGAFLIGWAVLFLAVGAFIP